MTTLSEALTAAQKRALQALEKAYVAGCLDEEAFMDKLEGIGLADGIDDFFLVQCLDVLKEWNAAVPAENGEIPKEPEPATQKQKDLITDLCLKKNQPIPEGLSKAQASQVIDELQKGSYDPQKWQPF